MKSYDHLAPLIDQENSAFEEFYADMVTKIPALRGKGAITVPPAGFKRALKAAYLAGDHDAIQRLINSPE
ncbi:hypothetical protein [Opitutus terrae]|uniref:Uncharacterized protein n=1 Tax=Opitutus terrae (strain DSM 11246 / JCM 15787 / PB90-1) TaxID=452637 RepID=B1ZUB2_OPITP|nr:hypothetical protein [Opitutus terrae]ACB76674.1 hypothetical protein Oter_3397 [Opitutus terrae PB90-1]